MRVPELCELSELDVEIIREQAAESTQGALNGSSMLDLGTANVWRSAKAGNKKLPDPVFDRLT